MIDNLPPEGQDPNAAPTAQTDSITANTTGPSVLVANADTATPPAPPVPQTPRERVQQRLNIVVENRNLAMYTHKQVSMQMQDLEARINAMTGAIEHLGRVLFEDFKEGLETVVKDVEKVL